MAILVVEINLESICDKPIVVLPSNTFTLLLWLYFMEKY